MECVCCPHHNQDLERGSSRLSHSATLHNATCFIQPKKSRRGGFMVRELASDFRRGAWEGHARRPSPPRGSPARRARARHRCALGQLAAAPAWSPQKEGGRRATLAPTGKRNPAERGGTPRSRHGVHTRAFYARLPAAAAWGRGETRRSWSGAALARPAWHRLRRSRRGVRRAEVDIRARA